MCAAMALSASWVSYRNPFGCLPQLAVAYCWKSGKLYWLALFHTDSGRDLDIGAFLLRIYRGTSVDGASPGSAKLQNLMENVRESSAAMCVNSHTFLRYISCTKSKG